MEKNILINVLFFFFPSSSFSSSAENRNQWPPPDPNQQASDQNGPESICWRKGKIIAILI